MAATIIGSPAFTWAGIPGLSYVGRRRTRNPQYGFGYEYVFKGTPDAVNTAYNQCADDQSAVIEEFGPVHTLTVSTGDDPSNATSQIVTNNYELLPNSQQKDVYEHPKALALGQTALNAIRVELKKDNPNVANISGADAKKLFTLLLEGNGSRSFQVSGYAFKATQIVSRRSSVAILFANKERLYTTAQVVAESSPPSGFLWGLASVAADAPPTVPDGYLYSWLKQVPSITSAAGNKYSIQNEWWLEVWSTWLYDAKA
jgi:hypothetical protein